MLRAVNAERRGRYAAAREALEQGVAAWGATPRAAPSSLLDGADLALRANWRDLAEPLYRAAANGTRLTPDERLRALRGLGVLAWDTGDHAEARGLLRQAHKAIDEADPRWAALALDRGLLELAAGELDIATGLLARAERAAVAHGDPTDPRLAVILRSRAWIELSQKDSLSPTARARIEARLHRALGLLEGADEVDEERAVVLSLLECCQRGGPLPAELDPRCPG